MYVTYIYYISTEHCVYIVLHPELFAVDCLGFQLNAFHVCLTTLTILVLVLVAQCHLHYDCSIMHIENTHEVGKRLVVNTLAW